eukprot:14776187-Alexandrium_andersonii.AAC.1
MARSGARRGARDARAARVPRFAAAPSGVTLALQAQRSGQRRPLAGVGAGGRVEAAVGGTVRRCRLGRRLRWAS